MEISLYGSYRPDIVMLETDLLRSSDNFGTWEGLDLDLRTYRAYLRSFFTGRTKGYLVKNTESGLYD